MSCRAVIAVLHFVECFSGDMNMASALVIYATVSAVLLSVTQRAYLVQTRIARH